MTSTRENEVSEQEKCRICYGSGYVEGGKLCQCQRDAFDEAMAYVEQPPLKSSASPTPPAAGGEMGEAVANVYAGTDQSSGYSSGGVTVAGSKESIAAVRHAFHEAIVSREVIAELRSQIAATPVAAGGVVVPERHPSCGPQNEAGHASGDDYFDAGWNACIAEVERLNAAAPQQSAQGGWLPMESAPRDKNVMIICKDAGCPAIASFESSEGLWMSIGGDSFAHPTHWQPLPAPPKTAGGGE